MSCPDINVLQDYLEGRASDESRRTIRLHVEACADCRELVLDLAPSRRGLDSTTAMPHAGSSGASVPVGATIGRYVVLARIGEGGMGVVYAAYDPDLDRKVALKLIRGGTAHRDDEVGHQLQARLLREAHAMARVVHPNVATIYDVGRAGEQVFVAMELVAGETLAQWLARERRSSAAVLEMFAAAGRGLAAAHEAGLVHRDFKPSNVMIGGDGRVRVLDFGLARPVGVVEQASSSPSPSPADLVRSLTATGQLVGTPAYMAPEQLTGGVSDARSDQFSFCVALYEGLYGTRPFAATSPAELESQMREGRVSGASPDAHVSSRLRDVLLRGLSARPDDRFPSMAALLAELGRDPRTRLRRWAPSLAALLVLAAGAVGWRAMQHARAQSCRAGAAQLAGAWDDARRAELEAAFSATGKPFAASTFAAVRRRLDTFADGWRSMYTDACEATRVRGEQPEDVLDLRMSCLQDRRSELAATTELFSHADGPMLERAVQAADALGDVQQCADIVALRAPVRPPADPKARKRVAELREKLAGVAALAQAGKYKDALERAPELVTAADALAYAPVRAEALLLLANAQDKLAQPAVVRTLAQATIAAEAGRDDEAAARAWTGLVRANNVFAQNRDAAHEAAAHAQIYIDRAGDNGRLTYVLALNVAKELTDEGKYEEAQRAMERSLAAAQRAYGADSVAAANATGYLAYIVNARGGPERERSVELARRSVALTEKQLGANHPQVAGSLEVLGGVLKANGKVAESVDVYRRAVAILEPALGKDSPQLAQTMGGLANALLDAGRYAEALPVAQRSLEIRQRTRAKNRDIGYAWFVLASVHQPLGQLPLALDENDKAIAVLEPALGRAHPYFAAVLDRKATILQDMHRYADARSAMKDAIDSFERGNGPQSLPLAHSLSRLARLDLDLHSDEEAMASAQRAATMYQALHAAPADLLESLALSGEAQRRRADEHARATLEHALELGLKPDANPMMLAYIQWSLARVLWGADERSRARSLASQALALYVKDGKWPVYVADIEAWLRRHPA
jgi:tRNA A-37 threonylcarbamoyl transferase component Bud32/tetratricopeptide (TPR) repeat protein